MENTFLCAFEFAVRYCVLKFNHANNKMLMPNSFMKIYAPSILE